MNIQNKMDEHSEEISVLSKMYEDDFSQYFEYIHTLYNSMKKSTSASLTDEELEHVLLNTPLDMIEVSEKLNNLKMVRDITKIDIKHSKETDESKIDDEKFLCVINALIDKIERQTSFAKEFIMSCKKVWDSRINNDSPIGEISSEVDTSLEDDYDFEELPDYKISSNTKRRRYIK